MEKCYNEKRNLVHRHTSIINSFKKLLETLNAREKTGIDRLRKFASTTFILLKFSRHYKFHNK